MQSMCPAESAVLLGLHTIRMRLLVLRHIVIATLALRAGKCDLGTHDFHLRLLRNLHKKNTFSCQLVNYSIIILPRQRFFHRNIPCFLCLFCLSRYGTKKTISCVRRRQALLYRRNSFGKERELPISHGFEADFLYIIFKEKR